jgi:MtN3 and saliva related transmembrane protein
MSDGRSLADASGMDMDETMFLGSAGTIVGLIAALSLILQARRLTRLGSACEVSIPVRLLALAGYAIWLAYGVAIGDVPLILVDLAGVAGAALVLRVTLTLRRRRACPAF